LTDRDRGWAWCQALVGAPGKRIIMTGSPDCIPLVQEIADYLGEELTIHHLSRYTPIEALPKHLRLDDVKPGTAVIAFSRRDVLAIKADLEVRYKVAVIYGNLTPEVRREEARRFRSGEAQVLVATDSIALGLNLPIETVCFSTLQKWDGRGDVQLEPWQILQIGGRAGRYGHREKGHVGAMNGRDAMRIASVFDSAYEPPPRELKTWVRPSSDHIEVIAAGLRTTSLAHALTTFQRGMTFDSVMLEPGVDDDMIALAQILDDFRNLSLAERLNLSAAPVDGRSEWMQQEYRMWMALHASDREVRLRPLPNAFQKLRAANDEELRGAEMEAKRLTLYSWLSYRYPKSFPDLELCSQQRVELDQFIERSLAQKNLDRSQNIRHRGARAGQGARGGRGSDGGGRRR
jgi:ATP-dependent RNA helicase SUPV3L1/SUV3